MNWLQIVSAILQLAPGIIDLFKKHPGTPAEKKASVMAAVSVAPQELQPHLSAFVDTLPV